MKRGRRTGAAGHRNPNRVLNRVTPASGSLVGMNWRFLREVEAGADPQPRAPHQSLSQQHSSHHGGGPAGGDSGIWAADGGFASSTSRARIQGMEQFLSESAFPNRLVSYLEEGRQNDQLQSLLDTFRAREAEEREAVGRAAEEEASASDSAEGSAPAPAPAAAPAAAAAAAAAAATGGEDERRDSNALFDPEKNVEERPPSPVVIWRPSQGVKLATNIPPELLADLGLDPASVAVAADAAASAASAAGGDGGGGAHGPDVTSRSQLVLPPREEAWHSAARQPPDPAVLERKRQTMRRYGRWYIREKQWNEADPAPAAAAEAASEEDAEPSEMDRREEELQAELAKLFICKEYKSWVESKGSSVPHFLSGS